MATFGDPKTFNPITENEQSSRDLIRFMFSGLTDFDWPTQTPKQGLAHEWSVAADGVTWTFKLRKGLKWSDGAPLTSADVVFTFDTIYNTNFPNATVDLLKVDDKPFAVTAVDDATVRIVTPTPYAPFLENVGVPVIPKHKLAAAVANGTFQSAYGINTKPEDLVGCGPFKLKQYKGGEFTLLERNPHFYVVDKKGQKLPYLDNVIYVVKPDMNAMSLSFLKGESDVHELMKPDEFVRFKQESAGGKFTITELGVGPEKGFLWFNLNAGKNPKTGKPYVDPKKLKWFQQTKFRQAIAHAIDRPSIIKAIYAGRAQVNSGFISPCLTKWHNPNTPQYPFDPAKAKMLLKEIGIEARNGSDLLTDADGNVIEFTLNTNTGNNIRDRIAVFIQEDLKRLGIKLNYQPIEFNTLVHRIDETFDYEAMLLALGGGSADPSASMNVLKSEGFTHFWWPRQKSPATPWEKRIDELMNLQIQTLDEKKRKEQFDEVQVILGTEMPFIYTVSPFNYAAAKSGLGNLRPTVLSSHRLTWNAEELYWKKK
ncbi:MAG: ABC transporter substrate-binding protein [Verrucomicrobia bacterium]|nr:ABC transporter substrate-binding protein [Verrucomicrobiota bacterium]